ncbi:MAG TPA: prepilin peptidase [Candidatus Acidoferrum sp.]|nr:prepilin peptidase [Candidatus Acidoferrum sp.]
MIVFIFLFGIVIGSFLNVCILRIPEELSIVMPASRCPQCHALIKWYDNVPVFGWMWLRGKCRNCGTAISAMYPLVELVTGLLFVACYLEFGLTQAMVKWVFFMCLLMVLSITDLRVRLLPDLVNWPGFAAGLFLSAMVPSEDGTALWICRSLFRAVPARPVLGLLDSLLGAAFGSFLLWGVAAAYKRVRGREGMGMGDVKMMALVGAFLGVRGAFLTILVGTLLGTVIGVTVVLVLYAAGWHRKLAERASRRGVGSVNALRWAIASQYQLPLGTFLGIAGVMVMFYGGEIMVRWSQLFR